MVRFVSIHPRASVNAVLFLERKAPDAEPQQPQTHSLEVPSRGVWCSQPFQSYDLRRVLVCLAGSGVTREFNLHDIPFERDSDLETYSVASNCICVDKVPLVTDPLKRDGPETMSSHQ